MRATLTLILALLTQVAHADLDLAAIFSDHAVVQRDQPLVVWGTAKPDKEVSVSFAGQTTTVTADGKGRWRVTLQRLAASSSPQTLNVNSAGETIKRTGILIGDVWHASGQSNMEMTMGAALNSLPELEQRIGNFDRSGIRFLKTNEGPSRTAKSDIGADSKWTPCTNESVLTFSAVAFFFAVKVHSETDIPIGIIDSSRGGTPIEPFIPVSAFDRHPTLQRELELADNDDLDGICRLPGGVRARSDVWLPGRLFHSRLAPIADYAVRGCIWYQGESNCGVQEDPRDYQHKMRTLVRGWRDQLGNQELPFYFVQLPGYGPGTNWPYLREQQRLAADVPNTGMVVTIDLEHPDIHPPNKLDVGNRLANWALARVYGQSITTSGPMFFRAAVRDRQLVVTFDHAGSGLMIANKFGLQPPAEDKTGALNNFEITTDGVTWHVADAAIVGQSVVVSSENVGQPIAVRYAYSSAPANCNLFNRDGLPASPFCSRPELLQCDPGLPE